jgi:CRP/FNR family cyclic AMP-dependent transcriptional regulator
MGVAEFAGYVAALLVFLTFYMKTMVPLRVVGLCSNCAFITYGFLAELHPILILHCLLLPLNSLRLRQMLLLTKQVREASRGDLNMDWLKPFTSSRWIEHGDVLFHKGDHADDMLIVVTGRYRVRELGIDIAAGDVVGELGLLAPNQSRTQTLTCVEAGKVLQIGYEHVKKLYYQNPRFGFFFLQLITRRLFENIGKLESKLVERDNEILELRKAIAR